MSGFARPITPTKYAKHVSNESSSANINSSHKLLDDINLLLHVESLTRSRNSIAITQHKLEESYKNFQEHRFKYLSSYARYTMLVKQACTRKVLLRNDFIELPILTASSNAECIKQKLTSGSATGYINTAELNKFKNILQLTQKYDNVPNRRSELVDLQNATKAIQSSIEDIKVLLEKCTIQGLELFTHQLNMDNFPKLQAEYIDEDE